MFSDVFDVGRIEVTKFGPRLRFLLLLLLLYCAGHATAEPPSKQEAKTKQQSVLYRRFLDSMSLTPRTGNTSSASAAGVSCKTCGLPMKKVDQQGTRMCTNGKCVSGAAQTSKSGGKPGAGKLGAGKLGAGKPGAGTGENSPASNGSLTKSTNAGTPAKTAMSGSLAGQNSPPSKGSLAKPTAPGMTANAVISGSGTGQHSPPSKGSVTNPKMPGPQTNSNAPYIALGWEIVKPAGGGPVDWASAIATSLSPTDNSDQSGSGRHLEIGVVRSGLQTGPKNLLKLPPDVASVIYVLDCSSSMQGRKFDRVQSAIVDAVGQMNSNQNFALLLFNENALRIRGSGYRTAGPNGADVLRKELAMIGPSGGTDPTDALILAIQLKPDTIVILSDGDFDSMTVDHVSRLNRTGGKNTQINCVAIGVQVQNLRRLASLNGPGNYVEVP